MPTILIADDVDANRRVLTKVLSRAGYRIIEAIDGDSALERVREDRPDLALVDLLMPQRDGFEFVHRLRTGGGEAAWTPVVFITAAYVPDEVSALARSCGVSHVLSKSATIEEILQVVADALVSKPVDQPVPSRGEFSLELLRVITSKLSRNLRTLIPTLAEALTSSSNELSELDPDAESANGSTEAHKPTEPDHGMVPRDARGEGLPSSGHF